MTKLSSFFSSSTRIGLPPLSLPPTITCFLIVRREEERNQSGNTLAQQRKSQDLAPRQEYESVVNSPSVLALNQFLALPLFCCETRIKPGNGTPFPPYPSLPRGRVNPLFPLPVSGSSCRHSLSFPRIIVATIMEKERKSIWR